MRGLWLGTTSESVGREHRVGRSFPPAAARRPRAEAIRVRLEGQRIKVRPGGGILRVCDILAHSHATVRSCRRRVPARHLAGTLAHLVRLVGPPKARGQRRHSRRSDIVKLSSNRVRTEALPAARRPQKAGKQGGVRRHRPGRSEHDAGPRRPNAPVPAKGRRRPKGAGGWRGLLRPRAGRIVAPAPECMAALREGHSLLSLPPPHPAALAAECQAKFSPTAGGQDAHPGTEMPGSWRASCSTAGPCGSVQAVAGPAVAFCAGPWS
jgi:hypothetical protein